MTKGIARQTTLDIAFGYIDHLLRRWCAKLDCGAPIACLMLDADKAYLHDSSRSTV
jgi:hypothetical protein